VLGAIDRREEGIRKRLEEALAHERATEEARAAFEAERAELESRRSSRLREVEEEVETLRRERMDEVKAQVRGVHEEWQNSMRKQEEGFLDELSRRIAREGFAVARRILSDLAEAELEERVVRLFLARVSEAGPEVRDAFGTALGAAEGRAYVDTAFPLAPERQAEISSALEKWCRTPIRIEFREDPSLELGIELRAGDRKIAWSVDSYLDALRAETSSHLASGAG
jgi:F-type H+-transporting ATPase subunit b